MVLNVSAATVAASSATEVGITAEIGAATAAAAAALTGVLPMGADLDSAQFAAALNAAGACYVGTAVEQSTGRAEFAGAQSLAAATYTVADVMNNAALSL